MATRERMRSLPELPPPFPPDHTPVRSDVAPRASTGATPTEPPRGAPASVVDGGDEALDLPPGAFSPDEAIDLQVAELERWARANERRERDEKIRFWALRGTAFLGAVLAGITGALGFGRASVILSGVAALFVAIDAAWPGAAQSVWGRAVYDLRSLQGTVRLRWDKVRLAYPSATGAKRVAHALALLDSIQAKRDEIGKYLGSAEAAGSTARPSSSA
jgi:hypothetical protein